FVDRILTHGNDLCLLLNASVNAYRRLDPHFEAPNQIKASAVDRGSMVRIPIGNEKSARIEVRSVSPDANPYMVLYSIFRSGLQGDKLSVKNLRQAERYLPDNVYTAIQDFRDSAWTTKLLGADVKGRYADLKQAAADRAPACWELSSRCRRFSTTTTFTTSSFGTCSKLRQPYSLAKQKAWPSAMPFAYGRLKVLLQHLIRFDDNCSSTHNPK